MLDLQVNQSLLELHKTATDCNDPQFCDFIESEYLKEQVEAMKEISDLITNCKRVGEGLGIFMLDKQLQS
jgi:ferritin heavy chain